MDNPSLKVSGKTVLILGDFSLESAEDKVVALGHTFQKSSLGSQTSDWIEIGKNLEQFYFSSEVLAALLFLSKKALLKFSGAENLEYWHKLLFKIKEYTSLVFIEETGYSTLVIFCTLSYRASYRKAVHIRYLQKMARYISSRVN
jgi:hypothetical protein